MAILATLKNMGTTIGGSFKEGWERTSKNNAIPNGTIVGSNRTFQPNDYKYSHHPDSSNTSKDYLNNISNSKLFNDIDSLNTAYYTQVVSSTTKFNYENNFKIPADVLNYTSKNYKFIYKNAATLIGDYGVLESEKSKPADKRQITAEIFDIGVVPSMFNPLYGLNVVGIQANTPLINTDQDITGSTHSPEHDQNINIQFNYGHSFDDVSDCSIKTLVDLSEKGKLGVCMYKYADFMYCKNLGKIANNRLITLRRFALPIGDNIWGISRYDTNGKLVPGSGKPGNPDILPDIGRLVTWLDSNNKLEDILKYEYKEGWEEKEGKFQDVQSQEDSKDRGIVGSIVNLANPSYRNMVGSGFAGSGNMLLSAFSSVVGNNKVFDNNGTYEGHALLGRYDENRVYEPKGTIRNTHLYTGKLDFTQSFTLTFDYELRAYENINPRSAFMDLLNNIQQVTYRSGKFWGGAVWFMGAPANKEGWNTANAFIDRNFEKLGTAFQAILNGDMNFGDFLGSLANKAANIIKEGVNAASDLVSGKNSGDGNKKGPLSKLKEGATLKDIGGVLKGLLKNNLGRPALYATNSILTGDPVGLWHVTIGNPRNPIMAMGNMIIESSNIQHYGPLGIDDFPIGLKVTVTLKHAKPRDMVEIGKMYTMGSMGIGVPLGRSIHSNMNKIYPQFNLDDKRYQTNWATSVPGLTDGVDDKTK